MTAVASSYEEIACTRPLTRTTVDLLDEESLAALLGTRFRGFLGRGWSVGEALLLAVGYPEPDAVLLAHQPRVLH